MTNNTILSEEQSTETLLVVLDHEDPGQTMRAALAGSGMGPLRTALEDTAIEGVAVDLLLVIPTRSYEASRRARQEAGATTEYTLGQCEEAARLTAERVGREWLAPLGIDYQATGAVGRRRTVVQETVIARGSTRVYLESREPSRWRRLTGAMAPANILKRALPRETTVVPIESDKIFAYERQIEDDSLPRRSDVVTRVRNEPALLVSLAVGIALMPLLWVTMGLALPATESEVAALVVLVGKVVIALSVFVLAALIPRYVVSRALRNRVGRNHGRIDADEARLSPPK